MALFPDTPATLLARIAVQTTGHTDEAAWLRFFELYAPAIRKFAAGLGARDESEDVAQEIFLKLVDVLRQGRYRADVGKFRCYVAAMIRREIVSQWRKAQARGAAESLPLADLEADEEPAVPPAQAAQSRDRIGPTGVFASSCCYDQSKYLGGIALNLRMQQQSC